MEGKETHARSPQKHKIKTITHKQKTSKTKHAKTNQYETKTLQKIPWGCVLLAIYCQTWNPPLRVIIYTQWGFIEENWFFLCNLLSLSDSFLVRDGSPLLLPPLNVGRPPGLDMCSKPCACRHSLNKFICPTVLLCLVDTVSWESSIFASLKSFSILFSIACWFLSGAGRWPPPI